MVDAQTIAISAHGDEAEVTRTAGGDLRLSAERTWLVEGADDLVLAVEAALPLFCERVGRTLLVRFGNAVGSFDGGPLGRLVVHSDKWDEAHFDRMLAEITRRMALLPFWCSTGAEREHERTISTQDRVLYHAFVYIRHVFSEAARIDERFAPALRLVLAMPHRRLERVATWSPLHAVERMDPRALLGMVTANADLTRAPSGRATGLSRALGGYVPQRIEQSRVQSTVDVPENQFVKALLGQVLGIVERMRACVLGRTDGHFRRRILADCEAIERQLVPLARHALWDEVSEMRRVPAESQVLQRRRGYREMLRHFVRLRLTARLPLDPEATRKLLEIKDIAELYELWSFFEVERQVTLGLGRPPIEAGSPEVDDFGAHLGWGLRVAWDGGVELFYNPTYSRKRRNHSYSVGLRPDIVLRIPAGPGAGDHLFDAKFKVRRIEDAQGEGDDLDDVDASAGRRGAFKAADLYKMHAYRDAIGSARSVWILYPGSEFRFFDELAGPAVAVEALTASASGVGAIPLAPGERSTVIVKLVELLAATG